MIFAARSGASAAGESAIRSGNPAGRSTLTLPYPAKGEETPSPDGWRLIACGSMLRLVSIRCGYSTSLLPPWFQSSLPPGES